MIKRGSRNFVINKARCRKDEERHELKVFKIGIPSQNSSPNVPDLVCAACVEQVLQHRAEIDKFPAGIRNHVPTLGYYGPKPLRRAGQGNGSQFNTIRWTHTAAKKSNGKSNPHLGGRGSRMPSRTRF